MEWDLRSYSACLPVSLLITFESIGWFQPPLTQDSHLSDITFLHILCKSTTRSRRKTLLEIPPREWQGCLLSLPQGSSHPASQQVGVDLGCDTRGPGNVVSPEWMWESPGVWEGERYMWGLENTGEDGMLQCIWWRGCCEDGGLIVGVCPKWGC